MHAHGMHIDGVSAREAVMRLTWHAWCEVVGRLARGHKITHSHLCHDDHLGPAMLCVDGWVAMWKQKERERETLLRLLLVSVCAVCRCRTKVRFCAAEEEAKGGVIFQRVCQSGHVLC